MVKNLVGRYEQIEFVMILHNFQLKNEQIFEKLQELGKKSKERWFQSRMTKK